MGWTSIPCDGLDRKSTIEYEFDHGWSDGVSIKAKTWRGTTFYIFGYSEKKRTNFILKILTQYENDSVWYKNIQLDPTEVDDKIPLKWLKDFQSEDATKMEWVKKNLEARKIKSNEELNFGDIFECVSNGDLKSGSEVIVESGKPFYVRIERAWNTKRACKWYVIVDKMKKYNSEEYGYVSRGVKISKNLFNSMKKYKVA